VPRSNSHLCKVTHTKGQYNEFGTDVGRAYIYTVGTKVYFMFILHKVNPEAILVICVSLPNYVGYHQHVNHVLHSLVKSAK
jgi:hypothetical protein